MLWAHSIEHASKLITLKIHDHIGAHGIEHAEGTIRTHG